MRIDGCISLNMEGAHYWIEDDPVIASVSNSIGWDAKDRGLIIIHLILSIEGMI